MVFKELDEDAVYTEVTRYYYGPLKLTIPCGLKEILETLSRETMREQPNDLLAFLAVLSERMLEDRKKQTAVSSLRRPIAAEKDISSVVATDGSASVDTQA